MRPLEPLYTIAELAQLAKQSRATISRHIRNGDIHAVHLGGSVRIPTSEARRYLSGSEGQFPTPQEPV